MGLNISCLSDVLDEQERRGGNVTAHDRLGDAAINDANATHRHNVSLQAMHTAMRCASAASNSIKLGDKGDGSATSKAESKRRHVHLNDGHIPDIYKLGPPHILWEWKCYSAFALRGALGLGSHRVGGAASTTDGHSFAFGNTLEALRALVFGQEARGKPTDSPFDHRTGVGRVNAEPGDYSDAKSKGNTTNLLATESTGALSRTVIQLLHALAKSTLTPEGHDSTVYGTSRASPRSFFPHHVAAAVSSAIVLADALLLRNRAASLAFSLSHGM